MKFVIRNKLLVIKIKTVTLTVVMALPKGYKDFETYIEESLILLKKHSWIYNAPNTHLLSSKSLQETSPDWIDYFIKISNKNLNKLTAGEVQVHIKICVVIKCLNNQ